MARLIDFSNCPVIPGQAYNGANGKKIAVEYLGQQYMLKFPPSGENKQTTLSYTNSCISEYLGSSIFNLLGIMAQKTLLGTYEVNDKSKVVCACRDFTADGSRLLDFCSIKNTILDSDSNGSAKGSVFCLIYNFILLYSSVPLLELLIWARSSVWESVRFASICSHIPQLWFPSNAAVRFPGLAPQN